MPLLTPTPRLVLALLVAFTSPAQADCVPTQDGSACQDSPDDPIILRDWNGDITAILEPVDQAQDPDDPSAYALHTPDGDTIPVVCTQYRCIRRD